MFILKYFFKAFKAFEAQLASCFQKKGNLVGAHIIQAALV